MLVIDAEVPAATPWATASNDPTTHAGRKRLPPLLVRTGADECGADFATLCNGELLRPSVKMTRGDNPIKR